MSSITGAAAGAGVVANTSPPLEWDCARAHARHYFYYCVGHLIPVSGESLLYFPIDFTHLPVVITFVHESVVIPYLMWDIAAFEFDALCILTGFLRSVGKSNIKICEDCGWGLEP